MARLRLSAFPIPLLLSETEVGILVLSLSKSIVFINARAHHLLENLRRHDDEAGHPTHTVLPTSVTRLCDDLLAQLGPASHPLRWPSIQVQRRLPHSSASILTRGFGLPDPIDPAQAKLILMLEHTASQPGTHPPSAPCVALTWREQHVVEAMAAGLTNKQIGVRLNLREGTVKEYVKRIRLKVGPQSRGTVRARIKTLHRDHPIDLLPAALQTEAKDTYRSA